MGASLTVGIFMDVVSSPGTQGLGDLVALWRSEKVCYPNSAICSPKIQ